MRKVKREEPLSSPGARPELEALALEQGVEPVADFDDLLGDFWLEDEGVDEFVAALREWRRDHSDRRNDSR